MPAILIPTRRYALTRDTQSVRNHESALQRAVTAWIVTGLFFLLLPGTFLGAWNLIVITDAQGAAGLDPAWLQAHGHAQIFGWIGPFILGIGFYSLSKMGGPAGFVARRAWTSWACWTAGVFLRWSTNLWPWQWRWMLPASALLELFGFLIFFLTVRRHRHPKARTDNRPQSHVWMIVVFAGTLGFLASLLANLAFTIQSAIDASGPAIAHVPNQRLLVLFTWAFPVVNIWGFSARWLPGFLGLRHANGSLLLAALAINTAAVFGALAGEWIAATGLFLLGAAAAAVALAVFAPTTGPANLAGVHRSFPTFVRIAYVWLLLSAVISLAAAGWDTSGGIWGASRHALTVGYISTMVFAIGQRVLPGFCGMRNLFSPALMFTALALLNAGCVLRVGSEIGAYEGYLPWLWPLLPLSAVIEMVAVTAFAANLFLTLKQPAGQLRQQTAGG